MSTNASSKHPVRVPAHKRAELERLTQPPLFAWPTIFTFVYVVAGIVAIDVAAIRGLIPLWLGTVLNVVAMYPFFHVMHDAFHRAASSNAALNDWLGRLVMFAAGSLGAMDALRHSHMLHHRFTNGPEDPDHYIHGNSGWTRPLRWMTFDYHYVWMGLTGNDPRARKLLLRYAPYTAGMVAAIGAIVYFGYGLEFLMLQLLPQRIVVGLVAFVFLWLPHLDGDEHGKLAHMGVAASAAENLTAGTTMRLGFETLLSPLMQWHNYHLIHHLWPRTPAYNHAKVWKLMEPELRERDLRIQHGLKLIPVLHRGGTTAAGAGS